MNLATEPTSSRRDAFAIAADQRGLLPLVIEKDFWVCWTLEQLFTLPGFADHLLFKGGTSLSKVYGVIQRFSEDIDLSLSRSFLGEGLADPELAASNTQRKQRSDVLVVAFHAAVTERLLPALRNAITEQLGEENKGVDPSRSLVAQELGGQVWDRQIAPVCTNMFRARPLSGPAGSISGAACVREPCRRVCTLSMSALGEERETWRSMWWLWKSAER